VADSFVQVPPDSTGKQIATNDVGGKQYQVVNLADDTGAAIAPLTDAQLRATPVPVSGEVIADTGLSQPLTDAQLRADPVPVEIIGSIPVTIASAIEITNDAGNAIPVSASALPLPIGAATETALQTLQETCDTLLLFAQTLLRAQGRVDATGRTIVNNSEVTQPVSGTVTSNIGTGTLAAVTNVAQLGGQPVPYLAFDRPMHIYDNIKVT